MMYLVLSLSGVKVIVMLDSMMEESDVDLYVEKAGRFMGGETHLLLGWKEWGKGVLQSFGPW